MNKSKTYRVFILLFLLGSMWINSNSQIVCAEVDIVSNAGDRADFIFDSFSKYISGITYYGIANVDVRVVDQLPANPECKWMLTMEVENHSLSGSAANEWETLASYGSGNADIPKIEILDVRITNTCSTSPVDGIYQSFTTTGDIIDIIENVGIRINAGSCTTNVNGPGSYLSHYDEFHFQIDFRIAPGFDYEPGIYELQIKFVLTEVP